MQDGHSDAAGPSAASQAAPEPPRRAPSRTRQFLAVLRKNYLLQTRGRRVWWGGAGWLALLVEVSPCGESLRSAARSRVHVLENRKCIIAPLLQ